MAKRMRQVTQMVYQMLTTIPDTRSSDRELIKELYAEFYHVYTQPFYEVMNMSLPSFESIRRARQKIQAQYPELRAVKPVEDERIARQEEFLEYAREELAI